MSRWLDDPYEDTETAEEEGGTPSPSSRVDFPYLLVADRGSWRSKAKCLGHRELTPMFFGELPTGKLGRGTQGVRDELINQAKSICLDCSVRKECFRFAKDNHIGHGVWGGVDFFLTKTDKKNGRVIPDDID